MSSKLRWVAAALVSSCLGVGVLAPAHAATFSAPDVTLVSEIPWGNPTGGWWQSQPPIPTIPPTNPFSPSGNPTGGWWPSGPDIPTIPPANPLHLTGILPTNPFSPPGGPPINPFSPPGGPPTNPFTGGQTNLLGSLDSNGSGVAALLLLDASPSRGGGGYVGGGAFFSATATPLPAGLPLFAGGLGVIGLLRWRRKRRASAAIEAE